MERSSSPDRLEELLAQRAWVRRVARALVVDDSRADDLEQEAWVGALRRVKPGSPRAWLGTVLRRTASNMRRAEGRRTAHEAAAPPPAPLPTPEEMVERAEVVERVSRAVRGLEEPYRTTVLLRFFEDIPPAVIAQRLGVPVETVRTRLRRALAVLRERLDEEEGGDRRRWAVLLLPFARSSVPWAPQAAAGGSALASAVGVLAMSTKVKAVVVAAVLLLIGGTAAWRFSGATEGQAPPATHASGGSSHTPPSRAATTAEPGSPDSPTMAATDRVAGQTLLLEGEVADQAGAPVPGATVRVDWVDAAFMIQPGSVPADDAGGFRFAFAGRTAEVHAEAPGFAASDVARVEGNLGETRRLRLELRGPAGTVAGRVLDPAGNPLQGVVVRVGPPDGLGQPGDPLRPRRDPMVTDALGRFSVGGVVPGWAEVLAQTHSFSPWWSRVEVRARETKEIEIRLLEGAVLQGTVRDAVGSPAGGVRVSVAGMRGAAGLSTVSDTDGRYRLEGLAAGRTPVQADGGDRGRASADVDLRAGVEWAWDATLAAGTTLAGRLVDGKGVPIPGWWVTAVRAPLGFGPSGKTRTGEDGKFEIPFLDPRAYEVSFLAEEYGVPSVVLRAMPGAAVLLEVVVPAAAIPSAFFTGTLVDSAGKPVADASLVARSGKASRNAVYDKATGTFEIGPLPAGHYGLQLWSESLGPRDFGLREVGQGQRLDLGTLRVGKPGTAALLFQRGEGGPTGQYARFLLRRRGEDGRWVEGAQGPAEGRKTLVVAPGTYGVVVSGYQTRFTLSPTFEVREGEETRVEVTVLGERVRWVRITGPGEDMAPSSVRLTFRDRDGETVADGYWGAPGRKAPDNVGCPTLSPGEYEAEILTDSGETQHFHLSVGAEDGLRMEAPLQIRLR